MAACATWCRARWPDSGCTCSRAVVVRRDSGSTGLARDNQEGRGERCIDVGDVEARRGRARGLRGVERGGLQAVVTQHLGDLDERDTSRTMSQAAVWRGRCASTPLDADPPTGAAHDEGDRAGRYRPQWRPARQEYRGGDSTVVLQEMACATGYNFLTADHDLPVERA